VKQIFKPYLFTFLLALAGSHPIFSQITVTGGHPGEELARYLAGPGVEIYNITYNFKAIQAGKFNNVSATSNLKIDSGVVLTTGRAFTDRLLIGVNALPNQQADNSLGQPGDADIDRLLSLIPTPTPLKSNDACVLEFDFIPTGDTVRFNYVFASEEYPGFNCTAFTDIFLFNISGPGISGKKNMAVVPGTNIPVAINSVNNGTPGPGGSRPYCTQLGAGSPFTQYYVSNRTGTNVVYNGMTVTFEAKSVVVPCRAYHLKMVIADVNDDLYDSGVFLQAGSLTSDFAKLDYKGDLDGNPNVYEGCDTANITIRYFKKVDADKIIRLYTGGVATNDEDFDVKVPVTVTIPAGDSLVSFPLHAMQDLDLEGDEPFKIYVSANPCNVNNPIYTDSLLLTVKEFRPIKISPPIAGICPGQSVQLEVLNPASLSGGFLWTPAAGLTSATVYNPFASPDTSTLYTVSSSFSASCKGRGTAYVQLKDTSSIIIIKTDLTCVPNNGTITVTAGVTWEFPRYSLNGGPFTTNNVFTGLGVGTYTITVLDNTGCRATKSVTLVQLENVKGSVTTTTASCFGENGTVTIHAQAGLAPYEYSLNGVFYGADSVITNVPAGNITAYIKDASGCVARIPFILDSDPPIVFTTVITPDGCRGLPDGTITVTPTGGSGSQYEYSADNGVIFQTGNVLNVAAGLHTVIVKDNKGCKGQQDITVPLNNTVTATAGRDTTICEGTTAVLLAASNAKEFLWTPALGLSEDDVLQPLASPITTTTYTLLAKSGLCERTDDVTITVNTAPVADAGPDAEICFGRATQLNGSGSIDFKWFPNQHLSNRNIANPIASPRQTTAYWLYVTDNNQCTSVLPDTVLVTVIPPVKVFAGNDTIVAINQPLQLNGTTSAGNAQFLWSPALGLSDAAIANPIAILQNDQRYVLTVTTTRGNCQGSDVIDIKVYAGPEIYVPTAFTPNGDGKNDVLMAIPAGIKTFQYFEVFNRWGNKLFSTNNYRNGWDGRHKGAEQPADSYIFIARGVDYNGKTITRKGAVVLVR
jgi:gliding motility-associated-like protein